METDEEGNVKKLLTRIESKALLQMAWWSNRIEAPLDL